MKQVNVMMSEADLREVEEALPGLGSGPAIRSAALLWARRHKELFAALSAIKKPEGENESI